MADETVPQIKTMAGQLLSNNGFEKEPPAPAPSTESQSENETDYETAPVPQTAAIDRNFHDDLLSAIERTNESADEEDFIDERSSAREREVFVESNLGDPVSPGIRDLVSRIENAVGEDFLDTAPAAEENSEPDDELNRDLREIEALRGELHGLRQRISSGAM